MQIFKKKNESSIPPRDISAEKSVAENASDSDEENREQPFIICDSLVKIYKTDDVEVMALQGLDLEIRRGEFMAIIGKSGSGKSTLLNIIGALETPSAGKIIVDGKDLSNLSEKERTAYRRSTVGFIWQRATQNLFSYMSVLENVEAMTYFDHMKEKDRREKARRLLETVGLGDRLDARPNQLSGGQQQRVAIAMALMNDPKLLIADEPTGAVDSRTSAMLQEVFREVNRKLGLTVIIVTHDISLANRVDRVVMISDGKISTEKVIREEYREKMNELDASGEGSHEEYSVLDKAGRVKLSDEMLEEAGIDSSRVKVEVKDGQIVITGIER